MNNNLNQQRNFLLSQEFNQQNFSNTFNNNVGVIQITTTIKISTR
jgi:hypothetical protein